MSDQAWHRHLGWGSHCIAVILHQNIVPETAREGEGNAGRLGSRILQNEASTRNRSFLHLLTRIVSARVSRRFPTFPLSLVPFPVSPWT
jgi:hypothetical protein